MALEHVTAPFAPFMDPRTTHPPGVSALPLDEWLLVDETYGDQITLRDRLLAKRRDIVLRGDGGEAAAECMEMAVEALLLHSGFARTDWVISRPDGVAIPIDAQAPLATLARLAQEDFLVLQKPEGAAEHVLTGGVLCFPSRWSLAEKMNRPLIGIHARVPDYETGLASRVQRFFDALKPERPLQRANWLVHSTPELFQPVNEADKIGAERPAEDRFWLRVERQCLLRLPKTGAVVFTVKTLVTPLERLTRAQLDRLSVALHEQPDSMVRYHGGKRYHDKAQATIGRLLAQ